MIITITFKGIKLECDVKVTVTRDPYGTLSTIGVASPTEYDVDFDAISIDTSLNIMPLLENDLDKITDLVLEQYCE